MKKKHSYEIDDLSSRYTSNAIQFNNFVITAPLVSSTNVCQSGHKKVCLPGWHTRTRIYDHYIIHYVLSGKGTYTAQNKTHSISTGDLFLINPYESIYYQADSKEPWTYYWVGFKGHEAKNLINSSIFSSNNLVFHYGLDEVLPDIFDHLSYPTKESPAQEYELLSYLYQLFTQILKPSQVVLSSYDRYLAIATDYIHQNYFRTDLSVVEISNYIGIDRTHLYRVFSKTLDLSIQNYIVEYRLEKAISLLTHTNFSLKVISGNCGFENQSYFSSTFKKYYHITPLQYRKSYLKNDKNV